MPNSISSNFDFFTKVLEVHKKRAEILANNIANADTPNYVAKDLDFKAAIKAIKQENQNSKFTNNGFNNTSLSLDDQFFSNFERYRVVTQSKLDNNTVDRFVENAKFGENSLRYSTVLKLYNHKIKAIKMAIKG